MTNLAPQHKLGLVLAPPLLLAAGTVSYGETLPPGLDLADVGAIVVGPVMAQSRSGWHGERLAHQPGVLVLETGAQNRGVAAAVRKFAPLWTTLPCAVLVQVADTTLPDLTQTIETLQTTTGFDGIEILIPDDLPISQVRTFLTTARAMCDTPLLARLPLARAPRLAGIAVECAVDALVIGEPPRATLPLLKQAPDLPAPLLSGRHYTPAHFAWMLESLREISLRHPLFPLVAAAGIHSPQMARIALGTGALAIALDSAVWIDPFVISAVARAL